MKVAWHVNIRYAKVGIAHTGYKFQTPILWYHANIGNLFFPQCMKHITIFLRRQLPNSKSPLSWFSLLLSVPSLTWARPLPLTCNTNWSSPHATMLHNLTNVSVASISGINWLTLHLVNVNRWILKICFPRKLKVAHRSLGNSLPASHMY